jgi:hypothetical protein
MATRQNRIAARERLPIKPIRLILEHNPEMWTPVFGNDHARTRGWSVMTIRREVITL